MQGVQTTISAYGWKTPAPQTLVMPSGPSNTKRNALKKRKKTPGGVTKTRRRTTSRQRSTKSLELTLDQGGAPPPKNISLSPKSTAPPSMPHSSSIISKTHDAPLSVPLWGKESEVYTTTLHPAPVPNTQMFLTCPQQHLFSGREPFTDTVTWAVTDQGDEPLLT